VTQDIFCWWEDVLPSVLTTDTSRELRIRLLHVSHAIIPARRAQVQTITSAIVAMVMLILILKVSMGRHFVTIKILYLGYFLPRDGITFCLLDFSSTL
jgi:hypothetical protein